jgi:type I restriction enzyme, S subunit
MKDGLPRGWIKSNIGECFLEIRNGTTATQNAEGEGLPVSRIETIQGGQFDLTRIGHLQGVPSEAIEKFRYRLGDIAFSHINSLEHVGKTALYEDMPAVFIHGMNLLRLRLGHAHIDARFAYYFMQTDYFRDQVRQRVGHAVNQVSINQKNLSDVPFFVAPYGEQRRIVAVLDGLLPKVGTCQKRFSRLPKMLKRFRQSVLAAACSGQLTSDWRENHPNHGSAQDAIDQLSDSEPEDRLNTFEASSLRDIPASWRWVKLGRLGKLVGGGTPSKQNPTYWAGNIPWVSPKDMKVDRIVQTEDHITKSALQNSSAKMVPKGSILFVVRGMILIHTLPTAITDAPLSLNQDMKALIPGNSNMSEYLALAARHVAPQILFKVKEATHGTRRIESDLLKNWAIPIPPVKEQIEIVRLVKHLFLVSDRIEKQFADAMEHVHKLPPSILAKAFRGELAPQDPNDEPVERLLERVKQSSPEGRSEKLGAKRRSIGSKVRDGA